MNEKTFSVELLRNLRNNVTNAKDEICKSNPKMEELIKMIDSFKKDGASSYPNVISDLSLMIDNLSMIPPETAGMIADSAKKCCLECMFHADDCFINIIFLIFKSLELNIAMQPNKIRPTMRQEAFQHTIAKMKTPNG